MEHNLVDSISIPIEPAVENVVFTRKQPELGAGLLAALAGEYTMPIEGLVFTVTVHDGKVYAAQTGSPLEEIKPYKLTADWVGFTLKRTRLDFAREGEAVTRLVLKDMGMTLEAPRK